MIKTLERKRKEAGGKRERKKERKKTRKDY